MAAHLQEQCLEQFHDPDGLFRGPAHLVSPCHIVEDLDLVFFLSGPQTLVKAMPTTRRVPKKGPAHTFVGRHLAVERR